MKASLDFTLLYISTAEVFIENRTWSLNTGKWKHCLGQLSWLTGILSSLFVICKYLKRKTLMIFQSPVYRTWAPLARFRNDLKYPVMMHTVDLNRWLSFTFMHLADTFIQSDLQCIQAIHFFISICVPWELNPQPFALLTQCSTTEPQEHLSAPVAHVIKLKCCSQSV